MARLSTWGYEIKGVLAAASLMTTLRRCPIAVLILAAPLAGQTLKQVATIDLPVSADLDRLYLPSGGKAPRQP